VFHAAWRPFPVSARNEIVHLHLKKLALAKNPKRIRAQGIRALFEHGVSLNGNESVIFKPNTCSSGRRVEAYARAWPE